jgi:hygromycin-B 7''-O-kinase
MTSDSAGPPRAYQPRSPTAPKGSCTRFPRVPTARAQLEGPPTTRRTHRRIERLDSRRMAHPDAQSVAGLAAGKYHSERSPLRNESSGGTPDRHAAAVVNGSRRGVRTGDTRPVSAPPTFASIQEHVSRLGDVGLWAPYVLEILGRHDLADAGQEPVAGFNPTYPTFLYNDVVVKLFGYSRSWRASHAAERAAHVLVATDPEIAAPSLLGDGRLYDDVDAPWPYLITTRMSGVASGRAELSAEQRLSIAAELGRQVRRVHALRPSGVATDADWPALDVAAAAERSSLPPHLIAQIDDYLARLGSVDHVFVHGDLAAQHVFVENGRLTGIIDWGDAMVTDRHYELIQLYRDMFGCDKSLFRVFLETSNWPVGNDFPRQALGLALRRQAVGLTQHHTIDVFEPIAALLPLRDIGTLDELATELFAV